MELGRWGSAEGGRGVFVRDERVGTGWEGVVGDQVQGSCEGAVGSGKAKGRELGTR